MEELNQLELFMEQLGPGKSSKSREKDVKKKQDREVVSTKVPASTLLDAKILSLWLEGQGEKRSLSTIFADALEYYIEKEYPEARKGVKMSGR